MTLEAARIYLNRYMKSTCSFVEVFCKAAKTSAAEPRHMIAEYVEVAENEVPI